VLREGFAYLLVGASLLSVLFAGLAWRKRDRPGGTPLVAYNLIIAIAMAAYAGDILSTTRSTQILLQSIWFPGQAFVALTWVYVAIEYAGLERWSNWRTLAVLCVEPVLVLLLTAAPTTRSLLYELPQSGVEGSIFFAGATSGPLLPLHLGYLYVLLVVGTVLFLRLYVRSKHLYRTEAISVAAAAVAPWSVILIQSNNIAPVEDPSSITFAISGMALTVGLYQFKNLNPVPAARAAIVEDMGDGVIVLDTDGVVSSVNPAAKRHLTQGAGTRELVGVGIDQVLPDWGRLSGATEPTDWQELSLTVDGDERFLEVETTSFTDRFDERVGTLVVLRDITDRKRREQRLEQYKLIFDSVTEPVYVLDEGDHIVRYNDSFAELVGYDADALIGEPVSVVLETEPAVTDGGVAGLTETTVTTEAGTAVPCELDLAPVALEDGATGRVGIIRDISRRKAIESELAQTTEQLETLVSASPLAIISHDSEGIVDVWNPAAESLFGWTAEEVRGETLPILPESRKQELLERHEQIQFGDRLTGWETELLCKNGRTVPTRVSAAPIRNTAGDIVGTVSIITDITEPQARQRRLERQNERLNEFASLVSHDLRNPLQVAAGHLHLARESEGDGTDHIEDAQAALERMEALIDDTLSLAKQGRAIGSTEPTALATLAERAWSNVADNGSRLDVADPPTVDCDPDRVVELLENLFSNAIRHGASGGDDRVTISVGALPEGFYVADDGVGIPEEQKADVFESGFTTDENGTGYGLGIVQTIADAHGWTVTVTESESGGARFEVTT